MSKQKISDELIAKYMSGKASKEEADAVLEYLSQTDERVDDFLNECAAVELHHNSTKATIGKHRTLHRWWVVAAGAAAVAAVVLVAVFAFRKEDGPLLAEQERQSTDSALVNAGNHVEEDESYLAETSPNDEPAPTENVKSENKGEQVSPQVLHSGEERKNYAGEVRKENMATMVFPSLNEVEVNKQTVTFRWNSDAETITLYICNEVGTVLQKIDVSGKSLYRYQIPDAFLSIDWRMLFEFNDAPSVEKSGRIYVE